MSGDDNPNTDNSAPPLPPRSTREAIPPQASNQGFAAFSGPPGGFGGQYSGNLPPAAPGQERSVPTPSDSQPVPANIATTTTAGNPLFQMGDQPNVDKAAAHTLASATALGNMLSYLSNLQHLSTMQRVQQCAPGQPIHHTQRPLGAILYPPAQPVVPQAQQLTAMASASSPQQAVGQVGDNSSPSPGGRLLSLDLDENELSPYQCLVRKQIELFEQPPQDAMGDQTTQGRNRPVQTGQVGIRCRHCGSGRPWLRSRGAILFPSTLLGVYQTAQNMANTHLVKTCRMIPDATRQELLRIRSREKGKKTRKSSYGGGRQYWADSLHVLGVIETSDQRLAFKKFTTSTAARSSKSKDGADGDTPKKSPPENGNGIGGGENVPA